MIWGKILNPKKWWLFFHVVITSDYVFTDQYLLLKIKMDASVYLQFNQSTNQWLARSLTTNQKPCPVQNPGAKGSSCRLIFAELLVRAAAGYLVNNYNCDFFLFILGFSNQKNLHYTHATSNHAPISKQYQEFLQILSSYKSYHSKILRRSIWI